MNAMRPPDAESMFERVRDLLQAEGVTVKTGEFGADMRVELVNDGPVTLVVESPGA